MQETKTYKNIINKAQLNKQHRSCLILDSEHI